MPEGIGYDIAGEPQEDANVAGWKDFLKRPENLATALVLAAMVTSPKQRGQSTLNKALVSGAGALGFRGALEAGVADRRRQGELDQQAATAQAAEIAQGAERNRLQGEQIGVQREQVGVQREGVEVQREGVGVQRDALTTPPQLHPSQVGENNAQAAYLNALAQAQDPTKGQSWVMLELQRELARADQFGTEPDIGAATLRGQKLDLMFKLMNEDRFSTEKMTPEEKAKAESLGIVLPGGPATPTPPPGNGGSKAPPQEGKSYRGTGKIQASILFNAEDEDRLVISEMRRDPKFADADDATILQKAAEARQHAAEGDLSTASAEELEEMLMLYRRVMSLTEIGNIQRAIKAKKGTRPRTDIPSRDTPGLY